MKRFVGVVMLLAALANTEETYTHSTSPTFDLSLLGTTTATDLLAQGQNPLMMQDGTDGWIQLRARNLTQNPAGVYLSSLEGGFDGELVAKVSREGLNRPGSGVGLMARYSLNDASDYSSLLWQKDGKIVYHKRMGEEVLEEEVLGVASGVNSIWMRLRVEDNVATFAVAKDVGDAMAPADNKWVVLGERMAFSDFMYIGFALNPEKGCQTLESAKFSRIAYQPVGGIEDQSDLSSTVAARGFWRRQFRRISNLGSDIADIPSTIWSAGGVAWDWTVDNVGDAGGVVYRVVVKRTVIPLAEYAYDNTVGEILRVIRRGFSFGSDRLPPYESIDEGFHSAVVIDQILASDAGRSVVGSQEYDPVYVELKTEILTTAKDAVELDVSDALGEWARINNSVTNLKLYMADALASKYDKSRVRRFAPANYKLYTGFTLEKALTRTRKMLQFCFDAKTPDIFDVFLVPLANDMVDCHKASNRFENTANDLLEKHDNKSLVDQRDDALQGAAEYLSLLGMMASIDEEFEWRWRPQRNDLFGKVKWYVDGVGDPVYGNSNIPVKVYAALAMNRIARGANDPVFQQFNALISGLMSEDGGFAEGTDYLDWALQEALPVYSWGIANGWIKPEDVPAKVRTSAEWLLRSADPSGFIPRVDDAASVSPLSGLTFWVAPFSLMNRDQRFLDYTKELFTRFPGSMVSQDGSAVRKFLTYPVSRQGPEVWSVPDGVHVQGGIGKIAFQSGTAGIGIGLLAEDGFLKDRGGSHDQQDNSSFTLSRWDKTTNTVDHLVVDPGYPGYNLRADGNEARYFYHNTPFVYSGSSIGGVSSNGMLSTDALWERSNVVFPYLDDYMCATSLWNTIFTAAGGANGWILGQVIQGVVTLDPYNTWANILMLPFVSVPFACGQFDLPNVGGIEGRAGGGAASFQYKYSNGLMSLQSYDAAGGNSSRAVFHEGDDVYVMDFFYREGVSADRKYGVSYNLPGDLQTEQSADNIWNAITLSSAARLYLFPGKASSSMDLENGAREYKTKDPVSFPVYRVSRAYQPGTSNAIFPHLSIFQTGPATATLDDYSTSAACLGAEICVERTSGTQRRVVFVRSGFPSQAGQVVVALGNGKSLVTDAGFGVLDIDQSTGNADVKHLYHVSSAELGGVALVAGGMMNEWPVPAVPRVADVKIGKGYGSFPNRILHVDENEVAQAEYEAVAGNNPSVRPGEELPVSDLNWFDAVVYANLRSQQDGLRSSYSWSSMTRGADGHVTALLDLTWDKEAPGYRLPTLEEWQALAGTAPTLAADGLWVEENAGGWLKGAGLGSSNVLGLRALWGNAAEWIWSDGESDAVVVGGNAADGIASLAPSRSLPKATTDALVGFRLVRSEEEVPALFGFDDPVRQWTIDGVAQSTGTDATGTRGSTLQFSGGYQKSVGPVFRTTEIATFGDKLLLDVFLPLVPVNPWWLGDVQVFISAPSQGIYSRSLGSVPLTGLTLGDWNTISVGIDASIQALLRLDVNDVHFEVVVNASQGDVVLLDNMRFGGNLIARTTPPLDQAQIAQEDQSLLGFENSSSWSAPVPISRNLAARTEGNASLQVAANGWVAVQSVPFASKALFSPTTANVSVDLFIPAPQPNPYWTGSVQLVLESVSAGIYAQSLGTVDLSAMAQGQFHHLTFAVPVGVQSKLAVGVPDLKLTLNLNTSSQAGPFLFDNIRGEP